MFAPWIHQSHTGKSLFLRTAARLPNKLIDKWSSVCLLNSMVFGKLRPTIYRLKSHFYAPPSEEEVERDARWVQEYFGCTNSVRKEAFKLAIFFQKKEGIKALNEEVKLCLKTSKKECNWGFCENYSEMAKRLWKIYDKREQEGKGSLKMRMLFAEKDCLLARKEKNIGWSCGETHVAEMAFKWTVQSPGERVMALW